MAGCRRPGAAAAVLHLRLRGSEPLDRLGWRVNRAWPAGGQTLDLGPGEGVLFVFVCIHSHYDKFYSITISGQQMDLVNSSGTWIVTQSSLGLSWWTPIRFTRDMELKALLCPSQWHLLDPGLKFSVASWRIPGSIRTRGSPCRHSPSTLFMPDLSSLKSPPVGMIGEGCSTSMFYWVS